MKLFNKYVICYRHYLKSILKDNLGKEYINPVVFINLKYMHCNINKSLSFQLIVFKIYTIIEAVCCFIKLVAMNIYQKQSLRVVP